MDEDEEKQQIYGPQWNGIDAEPGGLKKTILLEA